MKYWEEYQIKWGFGDGDAMPPDAVQIRAVYVNAFNVLADAANTPNRLMALDRPGMHNCYLVRFAPKTDMAGFDTESKAFALGPWHGGWEQPESHWGADAVTTEAEDAVLDLMLDGDIDGFVGPTNRVRWAAMARWLKQEAAHLRKAA